MKRFIAILIIGIGLALPALPQLQLEDDNGQYYFERGNIDFELEFNGIIDLDKTYLKVHKLWLTPAQLKSKYYSKGGFNYPKYLTIKDFPQISHYIIMHEPAGLFGAYTKSTYFPVGSYLQVKDLCFPTENNKNHVTNQYLVYE